MRILLDACVIFPTIMREMLLGAAAGGAFTPLWSAKIIEEWTHSAGRLGPEGQAAARVDAALMRSAFPEAEIGEMPDLTGSLPDPGDDHVLAAAVGGAAVGIMTRNLRDFPLRVLAHHGLARLDPDAFLLTVEPDLLAQVGADVQAKASAHSGTEKRLRPMLKRAGLPRVGKRLDP